MQNREGVERAREMLRAIKASQVQAQNILQTPKEESQAKAARVEEARRMIRELRRRESQSFLGAAADKAAQFGKGALEAHGFLNDLASKGASLFLSGMTKGLRNAKLESLPADSPERQRILEETARKINRFENIGNTHFAEELPKAIDTLAGREVIPITTSDKVLKTAGSILAHPIGGGYATAAKAGIVPAVKLAAKEGLGALGAGTALHASPRLTEEGTIPGAVEDITKMALGMKAAGAAKNATLAAGKAIANPKTIPGAIKKPLAQGVAKTLMTPNPQVLKSAENLGIELPFNVGNEPSIRSKASNFIANNALKSIFTSGAYKKSLTRSADSVINAVKKSLDTLGVNNPSPSAQSDKLATHVKEQENLFKKQADQMYTSARTHLKPEDVVSPTHTLDFLESEPVKNILKYVPSSPARKEVRKKIEDTISNLKSNSSNIYDQEALSVIKKYKSDPKMIEVYLKQRGLPPIGSNIGQDLIPLSDLDYLRSDILESINYDRNIRGARGLLRGLEAALNKDLQSSTNKVFLDEHNAAREFFAKNVGQRFRTKEAKSLIREVDPKEAYHMLNDVKGVKKLERIIGDDPVGKQELDYLKKAKLREIFGPALEGDLVTQGTIKTGIFPKFFSKNEPRQELIQKLIGDQEQYKKLQDIANICREFSESGTELLNTSGTAHVLSDFKSLGKIAKEAMATLTVLLGGGGAGGTPGVLVAPASVNLFSKLVSDKEFVDQARAYALARKYGKNVKADKVLHKLVITTMNNMERSKNDERDLE